MVDKQNDQIYRLINEAFRDIILCLGGIFLVNNPSSTEFGQNWRYQK
ncbi:MAG: hypothetical protein AB1567_09345 [bacterium]